MHQHFAWISFHFVFVAHKTQTLLERNKLIRLLNYKLINGHVIQYNSIYNVRYWIINKISVVFKTFYIDTPCPWCVNISFLMNLFAWSLSFLSKSYVELCQCNIFNVWDKCWSWWWSKNVLLKGVTQKLNQARCSLVYLFFVQFKYKDGKKNKNLW